MGAFDIANIGEDLLNTGLGLGINELTHRQQVRHQQDFTDQQVKAQETLGKYNQGLALDTWNKTNYEAQMKHIKDAGLNPGLLYGMGGAGGATTNAGGGAGNSVQSGHAEAATQNIGMALQMKAQTELLQAQKANIEADTKNKLSNVPVNEANVPKVEADTVKATAEAANIQQQTKLAEYNTQIAKINSEIKTEGKSLEIGTLNQIWNKLKTETDLTAEQITKTKADVIQAAASTALLKSNVLKNQSEIQLNQSKLAEIGNSIAQRWKEIELEGKRVGQTDQEIALKKMQIANQTIQTNFNTSTPEQIKQWEEIFTNILGSATGGAKNISGAMVPLL